MKERLLLALSVLMESRFSQISKPLRKNLACLAVAFVAVLATVRSGHGSLSLAALVRGLPIEGGSHLREKRLHRFLKNSRLDYRSVTSSLAPLLFSQRLGLCPGIAFRAERERRTTIYHPWTRGNSGYLSRVAHEASSAKTKPYKAIRYENVQYHAKRKVLIDVVVYNEPRYKESWYLLVPVGCRSLISADEAVRLYRERMQIEQSFRDFKTHLGLRGLKLQVDAVTRMGRLLLAFLLAYTLCILLGESELAQEARNVFETPRRTPPSWYYPHLECPNDRNAHALPSRL